MIKRNKNFIRNTNIQMFLDVQAETTQKQQCLYLHTLSIGNEINSSDFKLF